MIALTAGDFLLRLFVAAALGLVVGLEREYRSTSPRAAGMRTLALVSMGSALFTILSAYGFVAFTSVLYARTDPSRIAAQIVTGIGFLGAGAILLHKQIVRGLTTAAAVWAIAAVGMACGLGLFVEAAGATVLALAVLELLRPVEAWLFPHHQQSRIRLRVNPAPDNSDPLEPIRTIYRELHLVPRKITVIESERGATIELHFMRHQAGEMVELVKRLRALPQVTAIRTEVLLPDEGRKPLARRHSS